MNARKAFSLAVLAAGLSLVTACGSTDAGITSKVKAKLVADDVVKAAQIDVTTNHGVVTLTGNVDSDVAKTRALDLARETKGVVRVVDMIAAKEPSGSGDAPDANRNLGEVISDSGITMSVKSSLLDDPQVKGLKIDVDTRDGVVFLTGSVARIPRRSEPSSSRGIRRV
jgi:hyperosmotically inducible protein